MIMLAVMRVTSWPKEKMIPMVILRQGAQLYGSYGSSRPSKVLLICIVILAGCLLTEGYRLRELAETKGL